MQVVRMVMRFPLPIPDLGRHRGRIARCSGCQGQCVDRLNVGREGAVTLWVELVAVMVHQGKRLAGTRSPGIGTVEENRMEKTTILTSRAIAGMSVPLARSG